MYPRHLSPPASAAWVWKVTFNVLGPETLARILLEQIAVVSLVSTIILMLVKKSAARVGKISGN